jgi:peptidoglycan/LPS O-acetylase OafA/YrhL
MRNFLSGPGFYRFALALIVFIHHLSRFSLGSTAVYIFFSLSGFWVCAIWHQRYSQTVQPYLTFIISRSWRLIPSFVVCSVLAWCVAYKTGVIPRGLDWTHQILSGIFILGYDSLQFRPNVPGWSLDIEMQFYFLAPLLVYFMLRGWLVTMTVATLISAVSYFWAPDGIIAPYLFLFLMGSAAFASKWQPSRSFALGSLIFVCGCLMALVLSPIREILLGGAHRGELFEFNLPLSLAVAIAILPWTIYTTYQKGAPFDHTFGDLSYIVYLTHWPIMLLVDVSQGTFVERATRSSLALFLVMAVSWVIWKFIDHPINQLRSKWVSTRLPNTSHASKNALGPIAESSR